uniref:Retinol dehydrogenase 13 n=1 Tax=Ascaris suum TaxID=6253 RepID=F1L5C4_ASCSU
MAVMVDLLELFVDWKFIAIIAIIIAFRFYFKGAQFKEHVSAKNMVAVVTGCDCGIGKQIVRELCLRGAKVYMMCRNEGRALNAQLELVKLGCSPDRLIVKLMDLTKFSTIRAAAKEITAEEKQIDILVNNAAVMMYPKFKLTDDGHELVWQTNYLGHFLLTELLKPLLVAAASARIVNVSALAHYYADPIDLENIDRRYGWDSRQSYSKSKLAMVMHSYELTKRLRAEEASHVTINCCHPGLCYTRLVRYTPLARKPLNFLLAPFAWFILKTPKDGAQTPLYLALSKHVAGVSGQYFSECSQKKALELEDWEEKCKQLYEYSLSACGLNDVLLKE